MPSGKKIRRNKQTGGSSASSRRDDNGELEDDEIQDIEMTDHKKVQKEAHPLSKSGFNNNSQRKSFHVHESDLEGRPISVEDIDGFLSGGGPTGDPFDGYYEGTRVQWDYLHDRRGGHTLFVENEKTGELVLTDIAGDGNLGGSGGAEPENDFEDTPLLGGESRESSAIYRPGVAISEEFSMMEFFFLASYIFFQGLLAGFSMALIYILEQPESDYDLLINYEPSSNEIRRILFIFGAISSVGALELFCNAFRYWRDISVTRKSLESKDKSANQNSSTFGEATFTQLQLESYLLPLSWVTLLCYFAVFIILLIMAPTDVLISTKNGFSDSASTLSDDWAVLALNDAKFQSAFSRWKQLALYRVGFALLGWICSCLVVMLKYALNSKRDIAMSRLMDSILTLRKRMATLQGDSFDSKMSVEDYQRLINIQRLGLQRTEAALRAKEENLIEDLKTPRSSN